MGGTLAGSEGFQIKKLMKGITQEFWGLMELELRIMMSQLEWKARPRKKKGGKQIRVVVWGKSLAFLGVVYYLVWEKV